MAQILKLAQLNANGLENVSVDLNELVADSFTFGGAGGTNVTKTLIDLLILQSHAPMSDNQNVIAGTGLTGGGAGSSTTLNVVAGDNSLTVNADDLIVKRDGAGAVGLTASGLFINTDGASLEISTNALQIKDLGVVTSKLNTNAVTDTKLASHATLDANRAVGTDHIKNSAVTDDKLTLGINANKIADSSVSNVEFQYLDGVTSSIQTQLNGKQPNGNYITALTGDVVATGPGSVSATIQPASVDENKLNTSVAGSGLSGGSGSPLSVNVDGTTLEINSDTLRIKAAGVTGTHLAASVAGAGLSGGAGSALSVNVDAASLEIVTDTLQIKDSGVTTAKINNAAVDSDKLSASVAGAGLSGGAGSALAVNVDTTTIEINSDTLRVKAAGITEVQLATSVAGNGLSGGAGTALSVNVDGSTLEINTDTLRIKDAGVTLAKLASLSVDENKLTTSVAGNGLSGGGGSALAVNVDGVTLTIVTDTLQANRVPLVADAMTAGESFAANTSFLVRWAVNGETAGRVYKADITSAAAQGKFYAFGIALSTGAVTAGNPITVIQLGAHTLGSSDTPFAGTDIGKAVYLSTAGTFTLVPPTASATAVWRVGVVRTTSSISMGTYQLNGINP